MFGILNKKRGWMSILASLLLILQRINIAYYVSALSSRIRTLILHPLPEKEIRQKLPDNNSTLFLILLSPIPC